MQREIVCLKAVLSSTKENLAISKQEWIELNLYSKLKIWTNNLQRRSKNLLNKTKINIFVVISN